ncbi:hypothetical protein [Dubosiella newyorkensis]|uniref:hypothetical protein n=1 Tax=Dubosiella newyorkensis TaxID=1862672 RepID=UPI00272C8B4E|nr:hypothetical protein [Dubosiella newyorkensis]
MKNMVLIVLACVIVVCAIGIGALFWKKHNENVRRHHLEKVFKEKYGVKAPDYADLRLSDQKIAPFDYQLNLKYEKEHNGEYAFAPSLVRMGRFILEFSDPYQAIQYVRHLYDEGIPLVKKGEREASLPSLEALKAQLPQNVYDSLLENSQ